MRFLRLGFAILLAGLGLTALATAANAENPNPHIIDLTSLSQTDGCAKCHRQHSAKDTSLMRYTDSSRATLCLSCHDGSGASTNIAAVFSGAPANNETTRSYYQHPATATNTAHQANSVDEEGAFVAIEEFLQSATHDSVVRHSDCVDCHNPHRAQSTPASAEQFSSGDSIGWSIRGTQRSVTVVKIASFTGSTPNFEFVPAASTDTNFEYQLCLKCHSSYTTLSTSFNDTSKEWIDKGKDVNTANDSFHPIAGKGTNQTTAMGNSLAGGATWSSLTTSSTISCTMCHGTNSTTAAPHASANRGILRWEYRDRVLTAYDVAYSSTDFELCWQCHSTAPFASETSTATNFGSLHWFHMSQIGNTTPPDGWNPTGGTDIDTDGAGNGNAICSECHFRLHSTTDVVSGQTLNGGTKTRLVNFAPNVEANGGTLSWTMKDGGTSGSCTLTCHGYAHDAKTY